MEQHAHQSETKKWDFISKPFVIFKIVYDFRNLKETQTLKIFESWEYNMKIKLITLTLALSAASLANAHNHEQLISNDYQLFSPEITSKITEHKPVSLDFIASAISTPTQAVLK